MQTDNIIKAILDSASDYARQVKLNADESYDQVIKEANEQKQTEITSEKARLDEMMKASIKRKEIVANLDGKKVLHTIKADIIDSVFNKAEEKLNNLSEAEYKKLIVKLLDNASDNSKVILSKNSPVTVETLLKEKIVKDKNLTIEKSGEFLGGLIIENKNSDINLTFNSIINECRESLGQQISEKLFGI